MPTQGSCLPFTEIVVFFPNLLIVFLLFKIEEVGLTANDTMISCPEEIPPSIPPALLELNLVFQKKMMVISKRITTKEKIILSKI